MRVIIVGCGKVGYNIATQLCNEGYDVTVIDRNGDRLQNIASSYDVLAMEGDGTSYNTLQEAGIEYADLLIAVTDSDERNLLCCLIGSRAANVKTIARVRNPIYSSEVDFLMKGFGIAMIINPEMAAANEIARIFRFPSAISIETFAKGHVELLTFRLGAGSVLAGRQLSYIRSTLGCDVLVCVVKRGNQVFIPSGTFVAEAGDIMSIIASQGQANDFLRRIGIISNRIGNVLIVGGGTITYYLARKLIEDGIGVKIIEKDRAWCETLSDLLPRAEIIEGDGTNEELLMEEGLEDVSGFTALTGIDEQNIMLGLFAQAKSRNNTKVVTKIAKLTFTSVIDSLNLGSVVNPKDITADYILQFVRSMQASEGSDMENLYKLANKEVEVLEFVIRDRTRVVGIPIQNLHMKKNILIGKIYRQGKLITPSGSDTLEAGDSVVVVAFRKERLKSIDDILE